ncbi:MAG: YggS family pyridoxal phosphate-dependent enzyme [Mycobacteriales bacterium]
MSRAEELAAALTALEARLSAACIAADRERAELILVAVSKTHPASDVEALRELGVRDFGENRDQEAKHKAARVAAVRWHFVGPLQRNKAGSVASYVDVVHSVDRPALVTALSDGAVRAGRELEVLIQVSLDGDPGRAGAQASQVPMLADAVATATGLQLRGVMAVAPRHADPGAAFAALYDVALRVRREHPQARAISAGMTGDLEPAVAAGATYLRVGTALFGRRPPPLR